MGKFETLSANAICNTFFVCSFDDSVKFSCDLFGYDVCKD